MNPQDENLVPKLAKEILKRKELIRWHLENGNGGICKDLAGKNVTQREILHILGGSTGAGEGGEDA